MMTLEGMPIIVNKFLENFDTTIRKPPRSRRWSLWRKWRATRVVRMPKMLAYVMNDRTMVVNESTMKALEAGLPMEAIR